MSVDIFGTIWDQCRSMVQYCFTSTETRKLVRTDSPGRPPRLSHSSWTMNSCLNQEWPIWEQFRTRQFLMTVYYMTFKWRLNYVSFRGSTGRAVYRVSCLCLYERLLLFSFFFWTTEIPFSALSIQINGIVRYSNGHHHCNYKFEHKVKSNNNEVRPVNIKYKH